MDSLGYTFSDIIMNVGTMYLLLYQTVLQEVPAIRDFWYQEESLNAGNPEIRGLFSV